MKKILLAIFWLTSIHIFAVHAATPVWITSKIKQIYPLSNGDVVVIFKEDSPNCSEGGKYHYLSVGKNGVTQEGSEKIYSMLLASAALDKVVNVNFDADSTSCHINRASVSY